MTQHYEVFGLLGPNVLVGPMVNFEGIWRVTDLTAPPGAK